MGKVLEQYCIIATRLFVCLFATVFTALSHSVAIGELISNQAQLSFQLPDEPNQIYTTDSNAVDITKVVKRTPALLQVQHVLPANDANTSPLEAGCLSSSGYQSFTNVPHSGLAAGNVDITNPLYLETADVFRVGEPVFIQVSDLDQNLSETTRETVTVTVTSPLGDEETAVLFETGEDTGIFNGVLPTSREAVTSRNCVLSVDTNQQFNISYVDTQDNTDTEASTPLVDPYGIVYDTENGLPVNSATVTIYRVNDDGSTQVATVFADDGQTPWPSVVTTGQRVTAGEFSEQFTDGGFRFPLVAPGNYLIVVDAPNLIDGPSSIAFSDAFEVNGNTYLPLENGSYELPFSVPEGPPVRLDIPKDIQAGVSSNFSVVKESSTKYAGIGDFIRFTITAQNNHNVLSHSSVSIEDVLPVGLRYIGASTRQGMQNVQDPAISANGRVLTFDIGGMAPLQEVSISYIAQVIASAPQGKLTNTAQVKTQTTQSQLARADIYITDELMQYTNQLIGRVIEHDCLATDTVTELTNYDLMTLGNNFYASPVKRTVNGVFSVFMNASADAQSLDGNVQPLDADSLANETTMTVTEDGGTQTATVTADNQMYYYQDGDDTDMRVTHYVRKDDVTDNEEALFALTNYLHKVRGFNITEIEVNYNSPYAQSLDKNVVVIENRQVDHVFKQTLNYTVLDAATIEVMTHEAEQKRLADDKAVQNIRLFLEDGRSTLTDGRGRYHFDGIDNYTHVVQVDTDTLPEGYELLLCEDDTRSAQRPFSRFVDAFGGTLWRANFYLRAIEGYESTAETTPKAKSEKADSEDQASSQSASDTSNDQEGSASEAGVSKTLPADWLASATPEFDFVLPLVDYSELPATSVIIKHPNKKGRTVQLLINGIEVNPVYRGKMLKNSDGSVGANTWSGIPIREGKNFLVANYINSFGAVIDTKEKALFYTSRITKATLVKSESTLIADGKTPPVIAVQFTDNSGNPAHQNLQGQFDVADPYQAMTEQQQEQKDLLLRESINNTFVIKENGIAYIQLEPTQQSGEVNLTFPIGERDEVIRAWLEPGLRDWILVGVAEGTLGYRTLDENTEALEAHEKDEKFYQDGRLAFYAKGKVKGEWLLTMAYDTKKDNDNKLTRELIDPTLYFTLFADNTRAYQDAQSQRKLYLKIERKQFYALFGDYSTGFTETNLANYNRSFNGLKSEYQDEQLAVKAFAAKETTQFVKDEIQGDGTSGMYQLSQRAITINSESIRIETRDRFDETEVLSVNQLKRFVDYDIDYFEGKLLFKEPISSRDENLNPIVIVADYETDRLVEGDTSFGARASYQLNDKVQLGVTGVREARPNAAADLMGVDVQVDVDEHNVVEIETARTNAEQGESGSSHLIRYRYDDEKISAGVSYKNYDSTFGLGQQSAVTQSFEQLMGNLVIELTERLKLKSQVVEQKNTTNDNSSTRIASDLTYEFLDFTGLLGFQYSQDAFDQETQRSTLMTLGAYKHVLKNRLRVGINADFALTSTQDSKPQRYGLSLDYKILQNLSAFYQHELNRGENNQDIQLLGLRTQPWKNAELSSYVSHEKDNTEAAYRTYSNFGLNQQLPVNEQLTFNFGIDVAEELESRHPFGSVSSAFTAKEDYTAISLGSNYQNDAWSLNNQIEYRNSETAKRWGLRANWYRPIRLGYSYGVRFQYFSNDNSETDTDATQGRAEWSMAYRVFDSNWRILERFEYIFDSEKTPLLSQKTDKLINHIRANYKPDYDDEWSIGWSIKLNKQQFDGDRYNSTSNFLTTEYSHDFRTWLDAGVHASMLIADGQAYSFGPHVGFSPYENIWLTLGYNFSGFSDPDFSAADYTEQGPWFTFRIKFDQQTVKDIKARME